MRTFTLVLAGVLASACGDAESGSQPSAPEELLGAADPSGPADPSAARALPDAEEEPGGAPIAARYLLAGSAEEAQALVDSRCLIATDALAAVRGASAEAAATLLRGAAREVAQADALFPRVWAARAVSCEGWSERPDLDRVVFEPPPPVESSISEVASSCLAGASIVSGSCDTRTRRGREVTVAVRDGRVVALHWGELPLPGEGVSGAEERSNR